MESREMGLVVAQQLTGVDDLHYGYWNEGVKPTVTGVIAAQKRYTGQLVDTIRQYSGEPSSTRILDVGCGTGVILKELLDQGYAVDGVIPAAYLKKQVDARIEQYTGDYQPRIYECNFEDFPLSECANQYDIVLYSESYQYISMAAGFPLMKKLLKPDGKVVICDFFKTEHAGDGGPGDGSFGGGFSLTEFYDQVDNHGYRILLDNDITRNISPTIAVVDEMLMQRMYPAIQTINSFMETRHPYWTRLITWLLRKRLAKIKFKYFSGYRSQAVFERYKTYHRIVLEMV